MLFAIELLRLCAFLAPDAIPEEILTVGAPDLGPALQAITTNPFKLDVVFKELLKFSLIRRDPAAKTLTIHRLVQTVLRDRMNQDTQLQWADLNYLAGLYHSLARYTEAEPLFLRALSIREQALGPEHPDVATSLNNIALLYSDLDQFSQSEPRFLRALAIYEKVLGPQSPNAATILNNLALLYYSQQMFDQSESLFQRALTINERTLGLEHPQMAITWQNYACLLQATARYDQAAEFEARASALWNGRKQNLPTVTVPTGNVP